MVGNVEELSRIITEFRDRFNLSKANAAKVLGVSTNYVTSLETGVDINTGLAFKPREATLMKLAARMSEYAEEKDSPYRVTYKQLMVAAGYLTQEAADFEEGKAEEPSDDELAKGELRIPGLNDVAADSESGWSQLTAEEQRQVRAAVATTAKAVISAILAGKKQRKLR